MNCSVTQLFPQITLLYHIAKATHNITHSYFKILKRDTFNSIIFPPTVLAPVYKLHNALLRVMARQHRKQSSLSSCLLNYTGMKLNIMKYQRYNISTLIFDVKHLKYVPLIFGYPHLLPKSRIQHTLAYIS